MESQVSDETKIAEPLRFRQEVVINGLLYIFEGEIPDSPAEFNWHVSLPNWEAQKPLADEMMRNGIITPDYDKWLEAYNLGNGKVGVLELDKVEPPDHQGSIGITMVQTETLHLPE